MGDRALIIFKGNNRDPNLPDLYPEIGPKVSPVVYSHSGGHDMPESLKELKSLMGGRLWDVVYCAARLTGVLHSHYVSALSLGIWNCPEKISKAALEGDERTLTDYSHGDAGVIVFDCDAGTWKAYGGYLAGGEEEKNR